MEKDPKAPGVASPHPGHTIEDPMKMTARYVCPYCGKDPAPLRSHGLVKLALMSCVIIYCGNPECRKIHTIAVIEVAEPRIAIPNPGVGNGKKIFEA